VVTLDGGIYATTNGGSTWSQQKSGTDSILRAVAFPDATHGWIAGDYGTILATSSAGLPR